jgi:lysophospholipase L1-like esterase
MSEPRALRILALGDSYTIGEGVAGEQRWTAQLVAALRAEGLAMAEPTIIARTGWTTDELDAAVTETIPQGNFDLVTLLVGVNNQYRGRGAQEYREQFAGLLERALGLTRGLPSRVIVLSIPDWGVSRFAASQDAAMIAAEIDRFNAVAKEVCESRGVVFIDITGISRAHPAATAPDGLHPSGEIYGRWVETVLPIARAALVSETAR